jgi:putative membrane protein
MVKIIAIIFFAVIAVLALGFSVLNFQFVDINIYITTIKLPLAVALTIELVVGIFIGCIAVYIQTVKIRSENKILIRQLNKK